MSDPDQLPLRWQRPRLSDVLRVLLSPLAVLPIAALVAWNGRHYYMDTQAAGVSGNFAAVVLIAYCAGVPGGAYVWFVTSRKRALERNWWLVPLYLGGGLFGEVIAAHGSIAGAVFGDLAFGLPGAVAYSLSLRWGPWRSGVVSA